MCSISVEPMPSTIRMPVFSYQASDDARRAAARPRDARVQRGRDVLAQQRAVRGRRGEQRRDAALADRVEQVARRRPAPSRRRSAAGTARAPPSPNVNASGGVPEKTSVGARVAGSRSANVSQHGEQVAVEVHAALRRAGRAGREGDDRDVVGGGVDRLERRRARAGPRARGRAASPARAPPRRAQLARRRSACADAAPSSTTFAISPARSSGIVATTIPPASRMPSHAAIASGVLGECSSTRVARLDRQRRRDRRAPARAARRSSTRRRSPSPSCAQQLDRGVQPRRASRAAAGPARPRARRQVVARERVHQRSSSRAMTAAGPRTRPRRSAARGSRGRAARPGAPDVTPSAAEELDGVVDRALRGLGRVQLGHRRLARHARRRASSLVQAAR